MLNLPTIDGFSSITLSVDEDDESIVHLKCNVAWKHSVKICQIEFIDLKI